MVPGIVLWLSLMMPQSEMNEVERLSNDNYLQSIRIHAGFQTPCEVRDRDGILLVAGATDFPGSYWNAAARDDVSVDPGKLAQAARAFFAPKNRMYTFSVIEKQDGDLEEYLLDNEYEVRFEIPCMSVTKKLASRAAPEGVRIEEMASLKHVKDFVEVSVLAYATLGMPEVHTRAMFSKPEAMLDRNILGYIAYRGDEPLATAVSLMTGECGGLYWIGTRPNAQRLGLGALLTVHATNMSFEAGAKVVTLQASKLGEPVYQRLGFVTYDKLRRYGPKTLD
jgi:ribosomal protein S18 acetylase RimI-like enzyme